MIVKWVIIVIVSSAVGGVILMGLVYILSGIQARAWLDVFGKFLDDKSNNNKFNKN